MTVYYLRSTDGSDASDGLSWANAKATFAAAVAALSAGDTLYVSQSHSENTGAQLLVDTAGTAAAPIRILCANDAAEPPTALATGAVVQSGTSKLSLQEGHVYVYGMTFKGGYVYVADGDLAQAWILDNCTLDCSAATTNGLYIGTLTGDACYVELINTQMKFGGTGQTVTIMQMPIIRDCADIIAANSTIVNTLFKFYTAAGGANRPLCRIRNVGLQDYTGTLLIANTGFRQTMILENCQLNANTTKYSGSPTFGGYVVRFVNCDSGDTNYTYTYINHPGTITHEITIVLDSGATDGNTPFSRKMTTGAGARFFHPLESDWMVAFNNTSGSAKTATVEIVTDNTTLTDAEAWLEVEYMADANTCLGTLASDRAASILATPANQTASNAVWTTTGLATPVTQKLSVAFTPNQKGVVRGRVCLAKANTTLYFDPLMTIA